MDVEENKFFGLCKCCLQDGCFRSLWVEYNEDGVVQNYGEMLNECFSFDWQKPDNILLEQICDDCVKRTADAYSFRHQVLLSQDRLAGHTNLDEILDEASAGITVTVKAEPGSDIDEFEEVEYLEVDLDPDEKEVVEEKPKVNTKELTNQTVKKQVPNKKWPKKKKKSERLRTYKNYSTEELRQCIESVKSGDMTVAEASVHYNIPRKTVAARILSYKRGDETAVKPVKNDDLVKEICTLFTYTNMIPFKTRTARYHCAYCSTDGPVFEDGDELRTHTRTMHADERTKSVEHILRPQWLNEILKVDIENLHCTICCIILVSWNDMFKHLTEVHNLVFDEAYTRVIPFILKSELRCALCKEIFPNYHHVDSHMNAHYNNYVCSECGDTFLSSSRLKKHLNIHETGRFECDECGKVFTLEKYRKKHIELVHRQESNIKCLYCPEKFTSTYPRHQHVLKCHSEKVKVITCELCGKTFDWRPYFLSHVRRKHNNEKNYECAFCLAQFFMKCELRRHEETHVKTKGMFECSICRKCFGTKGALKGHSSVHERDVLFGLGVSAGEC